MALNELPYIHAKAVMTITSPAIDLSCVMRTVSLTAATATIDIGSQCAPGAQAPGIVTWTLNAEMLVTYDSVAAEGDGLWNQLSAIAGDLVTMTLKPKDATVSTMNPLATFTMYMPTIDFLNVTALGEKSLWTLNQATASVPVVTVAP